MHIVRMQRVWEDFGTFFKAKNPKKGCQKPRKRGRKSSTWAAFFAKNPENWIFWKIPERDAAKMGKNGQFWGGFFMLCFGGFFRIFQLFWKIRFGNEFLGAKIGQKGGPVSGIFGQSKIPETPGLFRLFNSRNS